MPTVLLTPLLLPRMFLFGPPTNDCKAIDLLFPFNGFFSILIISIGQKDLISTEKRRVVRFIFGPCFEKCQQSIFLTTPHIHSFNLSFSFPSFTWLSLTRRWWMNFNILNFFWGLLLLLQFESKIKQKHETWNEMKVQK